MKTGGAEAGTIKDAGDDPDVTHGALLYSRVRLRPEPGIGFIAGHGVGTVTRPGAGAERGRAGNQSGTPPDGYH